jgi:hypothetical protein
MLRGYGIRVLRPGVRAHACYVLATLTDTLG